VATSNGHGRLRTAEPNGGPPGGEQRLAAVVASVPDALITLDPRGAIETANPAAERLFDYPGPELVEHAFAGLLADPYAEEYGAAIRALAAGERVDGVGLAREVLGRRRDGSSFPLELSLSRVAAGDEPLLLAVGRDISERKRTEDSLRRLAEQDPLTGLHNRAGFERALARHIDYAARYGGAGSLLVIDIDNFKYVNDTLGHRAGDELIKGVAGLIRGRLRRTDVLGRLGGDEFAVLIHAADGQQAHGVAEELREIIAARDFVLDRQPIKLTVSVGMAPLGEERLTAAELLAQADVAMYAAKDQGRDRVAEFSSGGQAEIVASRALSERIRKATEEGLFVLVCQPILDLGSNQVTQYELLLRMRGEDGGLVPPGEFLATAERFGLIHRIDRWVAQQAVRLIASHRKQGHDLILEVNLSALSMNDPGFATEVGRELVANAVDPSHLIFEVTETAAVADLDQARRFAESLTRIGCRFALDDFGAGFASFYYLKHLPISYLKIDGEFVRELFRTPTDQLLVSALVQVSRGLKIKTIAEFVGDQETLDLLRELGVDFAQGYHIGRPEPVAELRA
jgi:diguanylate cyclase (GGDEF)-like protein/PAS domain S-box-containing protein